ncbi:transposase [Streptomyces sp. XH2]|uniref:transposase n=1 Tax=Streptomyces sp. XH2 TaxID=3412483 RepID=UPI003C7BDDB5
MAEGDRLHLKAVLANCPELTVLAEHMRSFAHMLTQLQGDHLPEWIEAATTSAELPSLRHFAQHLERDLDAVIAGLTQPWNSGVVEGHVNRIKMLKRQMFGRNMLPLCRVPTPGIRLPCLDQKRLAGVVRNDCRRLSMRLCGLFTEWIQNV